MPDIPPLHIMKEVGKIWQKQTSKDLQKYNQLAKEDAGRYQQELQNFITHLNTLRLTQHNETCVSATQSNDSPKLS
jgi:hypothetical protein